MAETMIEVRDLTKHFGAVQALRGVSFSVPRGQVVGLLGPNGAGKTTAMRIITGFLAPTSGTTLVDGQDVVEEPIVCRRRIGYLPEGNPLYLDLRVRESLTFAAHMHGLRGSDAAAAVGEAMEVAGLHGMESRLIGTVSKGYRQRVGLAAALLHKPDILILDEPTLRPRPEPAGRDARPAPPTRRGAHRHLLDAHPARGRGGLRPRPDHPRGRARRGRDRRRDQAPRAGRSRRTPRPPWRRRGGGGRVRRPGRRRGRGPRRGGPTSGSACP